MTFTPNHQGIGRMLVSGFMAAECRRRAEAVLAVAQATAPEESGEYKASIDIESGVHVLAGNPRAFSRVRAGSDHSIYVEYGGGNTPKHRTLGKALSAAGD